MDRRNDSQILPGTTNYLKNCIDQQLRDYIVDKYDQWTNYKKLLQTVIGDSTYIVNMTKPGAIRHKEIQEKTLEQKFLPLRTHV